MVALAARMDGRLQRCSYARVMRSPLRVLASASLLALVVPSLAACVGETLAPIPDDAGFDATGGDAGLSIDAASADAHAPDATTADAGGPDTGGDAGPTPDAAPADSSVPDSSTPDSATPDSGTPDASTPDANLPDAGPTDGATEASSADAGPAAVTILNVFAHTILHSGFLVGTASGGGVPLASVQVSIDGGTAAAATGTTAWSFALPAFKLGASHSVSVTATTTTSQTIGPVTATFRAGTNEDVDGDGFADLLVGAPNSLSTAAGSAYLYTSVAGAVSPNPSPTTTFTGFGEYFGDSVALADVNGDGYADVIVGDILGTTGGGSNNPGASYVFDGLATKGKATVPYTSAVTTITGGTGEAAGVVAAADVDGDGFADLAVGAQGAGGSNQSGAVYLFKSSGSKGIASGATSTATATLTGGTGARFGANLSFGDVNGDGYADLLVSAWGAFVNSKATPGAAYVFTSQGTAGIASAASTGAATSITGSTMQFAEWLALGDLNGDGYDDAVVTNLFAGGQSSGVIYVYPSAGSAGIPNGTDANAPTTIKGAAQSDLGTAVAVADVNGDGFGDLLAAAEGASAAYVYLSAGKSGVSTTIATTLSGPPPANSASFGSALSGVDVNGDGYADVTVGALGANTVYELLSSGSAGVPSASYTAASATIAGPPGSSQFGSALAP
jgi:hypothetical protein